MTGDHSGVLIDQDRRLEAEYLDGLRDLADLLLGMQARILGIGLQRLPLQITDR
jgi:hypothetical protein